MARDGDGLRDESEPDAEEREDEDGFASDAIAEARPREEREEHAERVRGGEVADVGWRDAKWRTKPGVMGPVTVKPRRWRKTASITHATLTVWRQSWGATGGSAGATFEAARAGTDARRDPRRPVRPRRPLVARAWTGARTGRAGRENVAGVVAARVWRPRESGEGGRSRARLGATRRRGRPRDARRSRRAVRSSSDPSGIRTRRRDARDGRPDAIARHIGTVARPGAIRARVSRTRARAFARARSGRAATPVVNSEEILPASWAVLQCQVSDKRDQHAPEDISSPSPGESARRETRARPRARPSTPPRASTRPVVPFTLERPTRAPTPRRTLSSRATSSPEKNT